MSKPTIHLSVHLSCCDLRDLNPLLLRRPSIQWSCVNQSHDELFHRKQVVFRFHIRYLSYWGTWLKIHLSPSLHKVKLSLSITKYLSCHTQVLPFMSKYYSVCHWLLTISQAGIIHILFCLWDVSPFCHRLNFASVSVHHLVMTYFHSAYTSLWR